MKLVDFVLCDDIRHEVGNKVSLIGVYNDRIIFAEKKVSDIKWPKQMKLGIYIRTLIGENERFPNKFVVDVNCNGKQCLSASGAVLKQAAIGEKGYLIAFAIVAEKFPFNGAGTLSFNIKYFENDNLIADVTPAYNLSVDVASAGEPVSSK